MDASAGGVDRGREAHPGAEHPFRRYRPARRSRARVSSAATSRTSAGARSAGDGGAAQVDRAAGEVADGGAHVPMAEVDADRERRVRRERHPQRRPAEPASSLLGLLRDHPGELELLDERGHGRARQPEQLAELGAAHRRAVQQGVHDAQPALALRHAAACLPARAAAGVGETPTFV